jgi:hypothetical protein
MTPDFGWFFALTCKVTSSISQRSRGKPAESLTRHEHVVTDEERVRAREMVESKSIRNRRVKFTRNDWFFTEPVTPPFLEVTVTS